MNKSNIKAGINILNYLFRDKPIFGPIKAQVEITHRCNLKCGFCERWQFKESAREVDTDTWKSFFTELREMGTRHISITGGEAILREDCIELVKFCKELDFNVGFNSNGLLLKKLIPELINYTNSFYLSLDGPETIHNQIRGLKHSYKNLVESVSELVRFRQTNNYEIILNMTINSINYKNIKETYDIAKSLGVNHFSLAPVQNFDIWKVHEKSFLMDKPMIESIDSDIRELLNNDDGFLVGSKQFYLKIKDFYLRPSSVLENRCWAGFIGIDVDPYGNVWNCPTFYHKLGNISETSIKDIWFSQEANSARCEVRNGKHPVCWFNCYWPFNILLNDILHLRFNRDILRYLKKF